MSPYFTQYNSKINCQKNYKENKSQLKRNFMPSKYFIKTRIRSMRKSNN